MQKLKVLSLTSNKYGFTLIELVVVISLSSLFITSFSLLLSTSFDAFFLNKDINSNTLEIRVALERIGKEVRMIPNNDATGLDISKTNELNFSDNLGNNIRFWLNGTTLYRNLDPLADNISGLNFSYLSKDLSTIAAVSTDAFCINFTITADYGNQTLIFSSLAYLRKPI